MGAAAGPGTLTVAVGNGRVGTDGGELVKEGPMTPIIDEKA